MFLIVGLGNPGKEYEGTRHNVGFDVLYRLETLKSWKRHSSGFYSETRYSPGVAETPAWLAEQSVVLARVETYMNESGKAVAALISSLKSQVSSLLIIHDDLALPVGTLRLSSNGSSGGQKGVQSIIDALGTQDFLRLRIGIGPNETPDGHRIPAEDFVLKKFRPEERPAIDAAIARAVETITVLLRDGFLAAQRFANPRIPDPSP